MIKLDLDWMINGLLDYEYKQYQLLGYLQKIENEFNKLILYPHYTELINHYYELKSYKEINKNNHQINHYKPNTTEKIEIDFNYINKLVNFSLYHIKETLLIGKDIFDEVNKCVDINELGLLKLNSKKGFYIVKYNSINIYEYELSQFFNEDGNKILKTRLIRSYPEDVSKLITIKDIKEDLINSTKLIRPSVFLVDTPFEYPVTETLLPIIKRKIIKQLR